MDSNRKFLYCFVALIVVIFSFHGCRFIFPGWGFENESVPVFSNGTIDSPPIIGPNYAIIASEAVILDQAVITKTVTNFNQVIIDTSASETAELNFSVGQILYRPPDDFANLTPEQLHDPDVMWVRKITGVRKENGKLILDTVDADTLELIQESDWTYAQFSGALAQGNNKSIHSSSVMDINEPINFKLKPKWGDLHPYKGITMKFEPDIDGEFLFSVSIRDKKIVYRKWGGKISGKIPFSIILKECKGKFDIGKQLENKLPSLYSRIIWVNIPFTPVLIPIGTLNVFFDIDSAIKLEGDLALNAGCEFSYEKYHSWWLVEKKVVDSEGNVTYVDPIERDLVEPNLESSNYFLSSISGSGCLDFKAYFLAGPKVRFEPYFLSSNFFQPSIALLVGPLFKFKFEGEFSEARNL